MSPIKLPFVHFFYNFTLCIKSKNLLIKFITYYFTWLFSLLQILEIYKHKKEVDCKRVRIKDCVTTFEQSNLWEKCHDWPNLDQLLWLHRRLVVMINRHQHLPNLLATSSLSGNSPFDDLEEASTFSYLSDSGCFFWIDFWAISHCYLCSWIFSRVIDRWY